MEDSGSVTAIADFMTQKLGPHRAILTVVLAGAFVTYGGVSLFVAFFVLIPMAQVLFRAAAIPHRLNPAAITLGTSTFTMSALPGTPAIQNAIPCRSSTRRSWRPPVWASSLPPSCSASAFGGWAAPRPPPAGGANIMAEPPVSRSMPRPMTRMCARHDRTRIRPRRGPPRPAQR